MRSRFRPHLTSPKSLFGIYTAPWTVPIRLDGSGCPGHRSKQFFVFLGVLQQSAELWADNMVYCCRKLEDGLSRSWILSWWAKASPGNHTSNSHPSHALHWQLIPKYIAITHPQHYCGVLSSQQTCLDGEERKQVGEWLVCETITLYYQPTCWGPKQGTLNRVWWFNVLLVYGQKLTGGMCAHPCPHLSPCWHKCDWLFELFWDGGGWTRNCILAAGTVCKEGKVAVCVTNAAVGFRVSC